MNLPPNTVLAAGPVIIENGKVLLNREQKETGTTPWFFPGGKVEDFDITLEETCKRETKEEVGIDIDIIRPLRTLLINKPDGEGKAILVHYLTKKIGGDVMPGKDIVEIAWHDIHALPNNCAPNVIEIIDDYLKEMI